MSIAGRVAAAAVVAMAALQLAWHGWLAPAAGGAHWAVAAFFLLPLLPALVLLPARHRRAPFWGALAALLYFCHGIMVAWSAPADRAPALAEVALSVALIAAASWDGVRARFRRRPAVL